MVTDIYHLPWSFLGEIQDSGTHSAITDLYLISSGNDFEQYKTIFRILMSNQYQWTNGAVNSVSILWATDLIKNYCTAHHDIITTSAMVTYSGQVSLHFNAENSPITGFNPI